MKYINADRLKTEIEKLKQLNEISDNKDYAQYEIDVACGYEMACEEILHSITSLQQEQPSLPSNLDEAAEKYVSTLCGRVDEGLRIDTTLESAFKAGAKWDREQMMKEAVEGEITKHSRGNNVVRAGVFNRDFEYGDKVRIIIVKED